MKILSHFNSKSRRFDSINDLRDFQFSSTLFIKIFFIHPLKFFFVFSLHFGSPTFPPTTHHFKVLFGVGK
jgi:hypothetical protein